MNKNLLFLCVFLSDVFFTLNAMVPRLVFLPASRLVAARLLRPMIFNRMLSAKHSHKNVFEQGKKVLNKVDDSMISASLEYNEANLIVHIRHQYHNLPSALYRGLEDFNSQRHTLEQAHKHFLQAKQAADENSDHDTAKQCEQELAEIEKQLKSVHHSMALISKRLPKK